MKDKELFEGFDVEEILKDQERYTDEVDSLYDPAIVAESRARTSRYTKADWGKILKEGEELTKKMANLMVQGSAPRSEEMQNLVKMHHSYIDRCFYSCPIEVYRGLGEMYGSDLRFAETFNKVHDGLAKYLSEAIKIYAVATP